MKVGKEFKFDAAHYLPNYEGKCRRHHGHTWTVEVSLEGILDPGTGMVMDFNLLSKMMNELLKPFDHHVVNDVLDNPTCENLVAYLLACLTKELPTNIKSATIRIQEGTGGFAVDTKERITKNESD